MGSSRGVWIGLALLASDSRPAFFVATGAPGVTPAEQELQRAEIAMRNGGASGEDVQTALAYLRLYFHTAREPGVWPQFQAYAASVASAPWARFVPHPEQPGDLDWWRANADFDPRRALQRLSVPVFVAWGAADPVVPVARNRPVYEALLPLAGRDRNHIAAYPGADHRIETGDYRDSDGLRRFGISEPYRRELGAWLHARGIAPSPDGPDIPAR
jgi:pimeloyl-ACP methyl ester carboxylesterase